MTDAKAVRVVRICVDAPGMDVVATFVATTETPCEVHDIILAALEGRQLLCGGYSQGQEISFPQLLDFVLTPNWKSVQDINALCLTVQEIAEAFNSGSLPHLTEAEVGELIAKASAREWSRLNSTKANRD